MAIDENELPNGRVDLHGKHPGPLPKEKPLKLAGFYTARISTKPTLQWMVLSPPYTVGGVARLVVAEIKRPGVPIGLEQKTQAWKYVSELIERGFVTDRTHVTCFVLGSVIKAAEVGERVEWDGRVVIRPMSYNVFIKRASARMLGLREKLVGAPFLREQGVDAAAYIEPYSPRQSSLNLEAGTV